MIPGGKAQVGCYVWLFDGRGGNGGDHGRFGCGGGGVDGRAMRMSVADFRPAVSVVRYWILDFRYRDEVSLNYQ